MVSAFSIWKRRTAAALALLCALGCGMARAQTEAKPAGGEGFSGTNYFTRGNSPDKPLPGQGRMDQFEQDLFGTHQPLSLDHPTETPDLVTKQLKANLARPVDPRMKEKMDRDKNWAFSTLNDLDSPPSPEELMGVPEIGPDGRPKQKLSAEERYYQNLDKNGQANSNELADVMTMMWNLKQLSGTGSNGINPMIFALPGGEAKIMQNMLMPPDAGHAGLDKNAAGDSTTTPGAADASAAIADKQGSRWVNDFKRLLDGNSPASGGAPDSSGGLNSFLHPQAGPAPAFNSVYTPAFAPTSAMPTPFTPSAMSPVTGGFAPSAGGYQQPATGYATPTIGPGGLNYNTRNILTQPSKPALPQSIDPFKDNFPKRNF